MYKDITKCIFYLPMPGGLLGLQAGSNQSQWEEELERLRKKEQRKMEPFVLFGSSFPKDREYTQV